MAHLEASVDIQAPPETVWDFLSDLRRVPEWVPATEEILWISEGPVGAGTVYRERTRLGPMKSVTQWRITAWEPPRRQTHEQEGKALGMDSFGFTLVLEPVGEGTRLTQAGDYRLTRWLRPLDALFLRRQMRSVLQTTVANLKAAVEAQQS